MTVIIRAARAGDQAYVSSSWVSSLCGPRVQWDDAARKINAQVDALLDDKRTRVVIACADDDHDKIIGWIASARVPGARLVEFCHVRRAKRREGIGRELAVQAELLGAGPPLVYLFDTDDRPHLFPHAVGMPPEEFLT